MNRTLTLEAALSDWESSDRSTKLADMMSTKRVNSEYLGIRGSIPRSAIVTASRFRFNFDDLRHQATAPQPPSPQNAPLRGHFKGRVRGHRILVTYRHIDRPHYTAGSSLRRSETPNAHRTMKPMHLHLTPPLGTSSNQRFRVYPHAPPVRPHWCYRILIRPLLAFVKTYCSGVIVTHV